MIRIIIFLCLFFGIKIGYSQSKLDFKTGKIQINVFHEKEIVEGTVSYIFEVVKKTDSIVIDAKQMHILNVYLNNKKHTFTYNDSQLILTSELLKGTSHKISIEYKAAPKKALYFVPTQNNRYQVWTQGQGKYSSNWVPSFDNMNEKVEFDLTIIADQQFDVIANGKQIRKKTVNGNRIEWVFDMEKPMSSYLLAFAMGTYDSLNLKSKSGIPIHLYYNLEDSLKIEPTYRHSVAIFDFLEEEIGYPYPWQNYKQIPVKDFLYAGMENTGTTIFSNVFVVDSIGYNDRNYVNVNAHELAHQWFGNLVTETDGKHHWLQEGFATYYALLAEKKIFGEDYFLYKLYENAEQLTAQSQENTNTSLLDDSANSLTFYQRGAWALYALNETIGPANFKVIIHNYLEKHKFRNVQTSDFLTVAEEVSGIDLSAYKKIWLEQPEFPSETALKLLTKHDFIKKYLFLAQQRTQPLAGKWSVLKEALKFPVNEYLGQEVVYQLNQDTSQEAIALLDQAFQSNNLYVRQAIATSVTKIPEALKASYEELLTDASYATVEAALYHLWVQYPSKRKIYLEKTQNIVGFNDKNVRLLWLLLALNTKDFNPEHHQKYYQELSEYTHQSYSFTTRENAFSYLQSIKSFSNPSLINLAQGTTHHHWRFRKFCRQLVDELLTDETYKKKYVALLPGMSPAYQTYINTKISE